MIIRNLIIIGSILGITFLSQQAQINGITHTYLYPMIKKSGDYISSSIFGKAGESISSKFTDETQKRGEEAQKELSVQKDNTINSAVNSTKNFIAEKTLQILGVKPEDLNPACNP